MRFPTQIVNRLSGFAGWFIPEKVKQDEESFRKASILTWISIGVIVLCSLITVSDALVGNIHYLFHLIGFTIFLMLVLLMLKKGASVSLLANLLMGVSFLFTVYLMYESGGLVSPLVIYLMIVPALMVLISEAKWAVAWIFFCSLAVSVFYYLHTIGILSIEIGDEAYYLTNSIANYISAIVFIAVLFMYSESSRRNARAELLVSKKRSDDLLLNVLPEQTAIELKEQGHSPARMYDSATVLFTDFKGFTSASASMNPQKLLEILNEYFMHFDRIIDKHGIEKIKTIGDAYMAVGGLPIANATHSVDVVSAALEIRDWIAKSNLNQDNPGFEIRIGVHTGPVVAGIVGSKKFAYDIWGDTVNTASRMESSGEVGKVNISEATYLLIKDVPSFSFTSRGKIAAKGKGEISMYFASTKA